MVTWLLICAGLASASPSAPIHADLSSRAVEREAEAEKAAATLSRFPAGHVPPTEPVFAAIAALGASGTRDHLALLSSLEQREAPEVQQAPAPAHSTDRSHTELPAEGDQLDLFDAAG